jgi:hypothetical protein
MLRHLLVSDKISSIAELSLSSRVQEIINMQRKYSDYFPIFLEKCIILQEDRDQKFQFSKDNQWALIQKEQVFERS